MSKLPTIEGKVLEESDIGREVFFIPHHGARWERGILSSFRIDSNGEPAIFVKYKGINGERTDPNCLLWSIPQKKDEDTPRKPTPEEEVKEYDLEILIRGFELYFKSLREIVSRHGKGFDKIGVFSYLEYLNLQIKSIKIGHDAMLKSHEDDTRD